MTKKTPLLVVLYYLLFVVICYIYNRSILREEAENISSSPIYAISLLSDYKSGGAGMYGSTSGYVKILFIANDKLIEVEPRIIRQTSTQEVGKKFLVIYYKDNPTECLLLLDYPINDSTDFKRYLEEFKTKPLDISKYFNTIRSPLDIYLKAILLLQNYPLFWGFYSLYLLVYFARS